MAKWGQWLLFIAVAALLLFILISSFVPMLQAIRRTALMLIHAAMGLIGLVLGWQDWDRWYGKVVVAAGALILLAFFLPMMPGRYYIMGGCTLIILIYVLFGYGKKSLNSKNNS